MKTTEQLFLDAALIYYYEERDKEREYFMLLRITSMKQDTAPPSF